MSIAALPSLSQILHRGSSGGHSFAYLVKLLFESEELVGDYIVQNFDDCRGDIDGADAFIQIGSRLIRVQIRFYSSPFSSQQRSAIKHDYEKHQEKYLPDDEWWLITPDNLMREDLLWFQSTFSENSYHKGEVYLTNLFIKHPSVGKLAYPNHSFSQVVVERNTPQKPELFFKSLVDPELDIRAFFAKLQPSYYECKMVFTDEWWEVMGDVYSEYYRDLSTVDREKEQMQKYTHVSVDSARWVDYKKDGIGPFPGGMKDMLHAINEDVTFYFVSLHNGNEVGYRIGGWCYINGRWIFFGKIFRFFRSAKKIKEDSEISIILKVFRWFGMGKRLKDYPPKRLRLICAQVIRELKKGE